MTAARPDLPGRFDVERRALPDLPREFNPWQTIAALRADNERLRGLLAEVVAYDREPESSGVEGELLERIDAEIGGEPS